jgi:hypothetical protein
VGLRSGLSELKGETSEIEVPELPRASASTSAPRCESEEKRKDDMYVPSFSARVPKTHHKYLEEKQSGKNTGRPGEHNNSCVIHRGHKRTSL